MTFSRFSRPHESRHQKIKIFDETRKRKQRMLSIRNQKHSHRVSEVRPIGGV